MVVMSFLRPTRRQAARPRRALNLTTRSQVLGLLAIALLALVIVRIWAAAIWPIALSVDEAQYLVWSRDLQMGYYSKPPFVAWILSAATLACGSGSGTDLFGLEGCVRWLQPLAIGGAAVFVYATAQALFNRTQIAIWAAVLFLLAPIAAFYSQAATTDAWLLLWWSAALWAFVKAIGPSKELGSGLRLGPDLTGMTNQGQLAWWITCGVFAGLGLLTKYSMGIFAVSALIVLVQRRLLLTPGPWVCGLIALMLFSPNLVWNAQWGWPTFAHHADITVGQDHGLHLDGLWNFFTAQWLTFSPLVFGMFLWGSLRRVLRTVGGRNPYNPAVSQAISLLLAFAWPMLLVVMTQSALSRAHANWASPALVAMSLVVSAWWLSSSASRGVRLPTSAAISLWVSLLINLLLSALLLASPWIVKDLGISGQRAFDPFVRLTGYKEVAGVVGSLKPLPVIASDDRKLLANLAAYLPQAQVYAFNPDGLKDNHWQLQRDLKNLPPLSTGQPKVLLIQTRVMGPTQSSPTASDELAQSHPELANALAAIRLEGKSNQGVTARWIQPDPVAQPPSPQPSAQ
jgi:4-amino-4-deoxy-L-arabinose transferase-like glycosyltransferase